MHNEVWGCAEIFPFLIQDDSKEVTDGAIFNRMSKEFSNYIVFRATVSTNRI